MRMHRLCQITGCRAHFHRQNAFADQLSGTGADDAYSRIRSVSG